MHFQKLRLSGFKSFVDPTEFRIEPGLTGVVGPNGCGKSNLLEALRWVMGASSAKAMRAGGMDDVIFAGSGGRPSRNHAEVCLTIDNSDGTAPAQFAHDPVLEVVRRIDRGAGSTYRVNGREQRARDVQLLFADASTGANSPALVRQGQISELIAARPQNRRMILEEAAGVSGLHTRRHEAELRLRAAEANLSRLDDVARELEQALGRLKREARQADKFKRVSAEIRALQGALHFARWRDAGEARARAEAEAEAAIEIVERTTREAAIAQTAALSAETGLPPLREEAQVAGAVMHRLAIENDRLEREAEQAQAEVDRLTADIARLRSDQAREEQIAQDAQSALARLNAELAQVGAQVDTAPERLPRLKGAAAEAEAARAAADGRVEALASQIAAQEAERRAAGQRRADAEHGLARSNRALEAARADRAALAGMTDPEAAQAQTRFEAALAALKQARETLAAAEAAQAQAAAAESAARDAARKLEDRLGRLKTEARGLAQLTQGPAKSAYAPALDQVSPKAGYEAALAAALGDDLNAALDPKAPAHWAGRAAEAPVWPPGVAPLAELIQAPPALAARLALTGLVERSLGGDLQARLPVGARIVSREGDLWRWDGFTARAEAPRPAAVRLEQKRRLADLEAEIEALNPAAAEATASQRAAVERLRAADEALRAARRGPETAERTLGAARDEVERHSRELARREARAQSLDETIARFDAERLEAQAAVEAATQAFEALPQDQTTAAALDDARRRSAIAREAAASARAALDQEVRERAGRANRLERLNRDQTDWTRRAQAAARRIETLTEALAASLAALDAARAAPAELEDRRRDMLDQLAAAETRQAKAADALQTAEQTRAAADRAASAAEAAASQARESRAAAVARLDAARDRLTEITTALREAVRMEPQDLGRMLSDDAIAVPSDPAGVEQHLAGLQRERDAIGPVNLRAEEEVIDYEGRLQSLHTERSDLSGAIARLREGIETLNAEGRDRLLAAFEVINGHFQSLFQALFGGGQADLRLIESDDPLEAGLEIFACPPGKRMATMSLMSGGEQALTAAALIFGVFLANPAPICVLDEVDAPLDDANVDRFCNMLVEMRARTATRFIAITHNPVTMARMDRLLGVTMPERGVSQLVSVDLRQAEALAAQ